MTFSKEQTEFLFKYYSDKMVGKYLDNDKKLKIKELQVDKVETHDNLYLMRAFSFRDERGIAPFIEISEIAKRLNLLSPHEALLQTD